MPQKQASVDLRRYGKMGGNTVFVSYRRSHGCPARGTHHKKQTGWIRHRLLPVRGPLSPVPWSNVLRGNAVHAGQLPFWLKTQYYSDRDRCAPFFDGAYCFFWDAASRLPGLSKHGNMVCRQPVRADNPISGVSVLSWEGTLLRFYSPAHIIKANDMPEGLWYGK